MDRFKQISMYLFVYIFVFSQNMRYPFQLCKLFIHTNLVLIEAVTGDQQP